jgi:S-adenosylmethionine:tRNA ribosyltransferase-isomerase
MPSRFFGGRYKNCMTEKDRVLSNFDYELPKSAIAQEPVRVRPEARLLVLDRETGAMEHRSFADIVDYLEAGDCLVLNDTRVLKARLFGRKETGGRVEVLLHRRAGKGRETEAAEWEALVKPSGRVRQGSKLVFGENGMSLQAEVLDSPRADSGLRSLRFGDVANLQEALEKLGRVPLPPYIDRPDTELDRELYQTVFAQKPGAVASPTAGLHFDWPLLERVKQKDVHVVFLTLHVGYGTFQPVAAEDIRQHRMHPEAYEVTKEAAQCVNGSLCAGKRVLACGTTVARTLETLAEKGNSIPSLRWGSGESDLFIYPPFEFLITKSLITNFHLPRTTLLMLVSAFAGRERILAAYGEAIRQGYRFYSYGDAMLIL